MWFDTFFPIRTLATISLRFFYTCKFRLINQAALLQLTDTPPPPLHPEKNKLQSCLLRFFPLRQCPSKYESQIK